MPKKKPAAKGPFFFFMLEFKQKQEAKGVRFKGGMVEIMERAGPHWDKLTPQEREPYTVKAKEYKANPVVGERYTAQGIPYSQVEAEAKMRREKEERIQKDIVNMVQAAIAANALEELEVIFVSCNYFCVTTTSQYIPAELAMVKYSLFSGIIDKFNILINPQKLPLGMSLDAQLHTNETHQLPLPPDCLGETSYEMVLQQILSFVQDDPAKVNEFPPLFTFNGDMAAVSGVLAEIQDAAETDAQLRVYPLNDFFFHLKCGTEKYGLDIATFPSVFMAKALLEKDVYAYSEDIGCEFHEEHGNPVSCALSKCVRWAYTISDSCCLDLGIEMEGGRHIPVNMSVLTEITDTISGVTSRMSKLTTMTSNTTGAASQQGKCRRPRSAERGLDQTGTTIFSSRAGTTSATTATTVAAARSSAGASSKGTNKPALLHTTANDTFNTTNPFYARQLDAEVQKSKQESKRNPWSRENRISEVRLPQEVTPVAVVGRGRGTLIKSQSLNNSGHSQSSGRGFFKPNC